MLHIAEHQVGVCTRPSRPEAEAARKAEAALETEAVEAKAAPQAEAALKAEAAHGALVALEAKAAKATRPGARGQGRGRGL